MAGQRTNRALFWVMVLALASGVVTFTVGTESGRPVVLAHGVTALAIVGLSPWKTMIASRGLRRNRSGRSLSLLLAVVVIGTLLTGLFQASGMLGAGPFTMMQLHVSLGLASVSLTMIHFLQRPTHRIDIGRRNLLHAGGLLAVAGALWITVEGILNVAGAKGATRRFTGSHEITDPDRIPATQWTNDRVQHLGQDHVVDIVGQMVAVTDLEIEDRVTTTLDCTGGWYTTQEWSGVRLSRLIDETVGVSVVVRSTTGYWRRFPLDQASKLFLATHLAGQPLRAGNGGPLRLVAPGRRGYWWVKWVDNIEVDDAPPWWQPPLPTA